VSLFAPSESSFRPKLLTALCEQRSGEIRFSTKTLPQPQALASSFACHSERSEEPPHFAFVFAIAFFFCVFGPKNACQAHKPPKPLTSIEL
jgi:hypothetical protein